MNILFTVPAAKQSMFLINGNLVQVNLYEGDQLIARKIEANNIAIYKRTKEGETFLLNIPCKNDTVLVTPI